MKKNQKEVLMILADIFYSATTITWDKFQSMALFLYKNNSLGPKGTKEVAGYLYQIDSNLKKIYNSCPCLGVKETGEYLSLADILKKYNFDYNSNKYRIIDTFAIMKKCIKNFSLIDSYIDFLANSTLLSIINLNSFELFKALENTLGYDIREYIVKEADEDWERINLAYSDKYYFVKTVDNYFKMRDRYNATKGRLNALNEVTINNDRKEFLNNCIYDMEEAFSEGDLYLAAEEIEAADEVFTRAVKR